MRIGFIGLGVMGKPMARNLQAAGYDLVIYNRSTAAIDELVEAGAAKGASSCDVAAQCDIIITMLPNSPQVEEVVLGENGIIEGVKSGSIVVDMSSIDPLVSRNVGEALKEKGVKMLDAPVSGGEPKAIEGTLAIMVGGDKQVFKQLEPVLLKMGSSAVYCGELGSGNVTKLANQIIVALNIAAVSEAMVLATKAGVDPQVVFAAIRGGLAGSTVLEAKMPLMLAGNFKPGFRIELHIKDLQNALNSAHEIGVPIPLTSQVMEIMQALRVDGKEKDDHGGIIQFYESLAKTEVRKV